MLEGYRLVCNVSFQLLSVFLVIIGVVDFVKLFSYPAHDVVTRRISESCDPGSYIRKSKYANLD